MKIKEKMKNIIAIFKYGGYNEVKVNQINYPDLLNGKNILITGGSSGIGYQIAKKCVSCGAKVIITGRNEKKLLDVCSEFSGNVIPLVWDIQNINILDEKVNEVFLLFDGNLDCLVNNAGIQPKKFFPNVDEKEWDDLYDINSKGTFFITQAICKRWIEDYDRTKYRKILNIDSQGGFVGATYPYRMTKWDIRGFTQGLGLKMAKYGVIVNSIAPGVVKTQMQQFSLKQGSNTFCMQNPLCRVALPEEIAELAIFMLSDACNFMVGQTILTDGGFSLK